MNAAIKEKIEAFLKKAGFWKLSGKDVWCESKVPNQKICDFTKDPPWIGISSGVQRIEAEDSGISTIQDYKSMIMQIYNSELNQDKKPPEAGSHNPGSSQGQNTSSPTKGSNVAPATSCGESHMGTQYPFICSACKTGISAEQRTKAVKDFGKALCTSCISNLPDARGDHRHGQPHSEQQEEPKPEPAKETKKKPAGNKKDEPKSMADALKKDKEYAGEKKESPAPETKDLLKQSENSQVILTEHEHDIPINPVVCGVDGCGVELSHKRALELQIDNRLPICEDCEAKLIEKSKETVPIKSRDKIMTEKPETKPPAKEAEVMPPKQKEEAKKPLSDKEISDKLEAEEQKKALAKTQFKTGTCEAVAKQYGIPAELANMFFMTLNDGLYIKNPGLLHLAAKKGYSRIEVTSKYNEKTQEWESESKVFPKVTPEMVASICQLTPELQKIAWDYMTAPTNGTGAASIKSVKMSTMHPFLKEMSQTRAQNRALRAYTGYGGTSLEELPEAEVKYVEG